MHTNKSKLNVQKTIEIRVSQAAASTSPAEPQAAEWLTYYRDITQVERERGLQSRALTRMDAGRQAGRQAEDPRADQ